MIDPGHFLIFITAIYLIILSGWRHHCHTLCPTMTSVTEIQLGSIFEDPILVQLDDLSRHGQISTSCTRQIVRDNFSLSDHDLSVDDTKTKFKTVDLTYIENDLDEFHKDALVQQALNKGVDLKKYYIDLEKDLKDEYNDDIRTVLGVD